MECSDSGTISKMVYVNSYKIVEVLFTNKSAIRHLFVHCARLKMTELKTRRPYIAFRLDLDKEL
ncbi:hypothetical protein TUM4445_16700 [Shewanella sp. MBTL60-112-B2]|nr:hypothetical protein TUM4444_18910 [Shewanella sp. MBTL60-112-B1]GIU31793.1 hypothetical protein TUM4445_16700 [Shewanella sp. MBTL60-112-B2]